MGRSGIHMGFASNIQVQIDCLVSICMAYGEYLLATNETHTMPIGSDSMAQYVEFVNVMKGRFWE